MKKYIVLALAGLAGLVLSSGCATPGTFGVKYQPYDNVQLEAKTAEFTIDSLVENGCGITLPKLK